MDTASFKISFIIRARNAEKDLQLCLASIKKQNITTSNTVEVIVVDNESTDNTVNVANSFNANVVGITQEEFTWGKALNKGIEHCSGDIVILISSDVEIVDDNWLTDMLIPFSDNNIVAVYAKQIPRINAPVDERIRLAKTFPDKSIYFNHPVLSSKSLPKNIIASNACAAIRKKIWTKTKFDESIEGGEELPWVQKIMRLGYATAYNADAKVYHSHNEPASRFAYRHWELFRKDVRLGNIRGGVFSFLYACAAIIKRRLVNLFIANAPIKIKAACFASLFVEILFFIHIALLEAAGISRTKVRKWMWK